MKTKRTTLIASETHEALTLRLKFRAQPLASSVLCDKCASETPLVTPEEAAPFAGLSVRAVYRLVENGLIHYTETPDGLLLICLSKLDGREPDAETSTP